MFRITLFLATVAFSASVGAVMQPSGKGDNMFPSEKECMTALTSTGNYIVYEPKFFDHRERNPVDGTSKMETPLPSIACADMWTKNGWKWVVQSAGTAMRAEKKADGTLQIYARHDCGNKIRKVVYPPDPPKPLPAASTKEAPKKEEVVVAKKKEAVIRVEPQIELLEEGVEYVEPLHAYSSPIYTGSYHGGYHVGYHSPPIYVSSFGGIVSGTHGARIKPGPTGPVYAGCCNGIASGTPGVGIRPGHAGPIYGGCGTGCGATGRGRR